MINIQKLMPWWMKIALKIIFARLPVGYGVWKKIGVFRPGYMDNYRYATDVFNMHLESAGFRPEDLNGRTILEIGPGDSIATVMFARAYGAKAILIDSGNWLTRDVLVCNVFAKKLAANFPCFKGIIFNSMEEVLGFCGAKYYSNGLAGWSNIDNEVVDFIFSQAVLEHVRKYEFAALQKECWRVLKFGGVASHRVDLRDHLGGALNNLRFSEKVWESDFFVKSGFYTNRIQMEGMLQCFASSGFAVKCGRIDRWDVLPTNQDKMVSPFCLLDVDNLNVSGFDVLLCKNK